MLKPLPSLKGAFDSAFSWNYGPLSEHLMSNSPNLYIHCLFCLPLTCLMSKRLVIWSCSSNFPPQGTAGVHEYLTNTWFQFVICQRILRSPFKTLLLKGSRCEMEFILLWNTVPRAVSNISNISNVFFAAVGNFDVVMKNDTYQALVVESKDFDWLAGLHYWQNKSKPD